MSWLTSRGRAAGTVGWTGFPGGNGSWEAVSATNLAAPSNAVNVRLEMYGTTGAVSNGHGQVLMDDLRLAPEAPDQTNVLQVATQPAAHITWPTSPGTPYQPQSAVSLTQETNWTNRAQPHVGSGGTASITIRTTNDVPAFFRLQL